MAPLNKNHKSYPESNEDIEKYLYPEERIADRVDGILNFIAPILIGFFVLPVIDDYIFAWFLGLFG